MKKIFSTIVSLVLVLSMLFAFTGCFSDQSKLVGTWKAEIEFGEVMNEMFAEDATTKEMAEYFDFEDLVLVLTLEFDDDDTYKMYVDEDDNEDFGPDIKEIMAEGLKKYLEKELEGTGVTVDQALQAQDTTLEELVETIFTDKMVEDIFDEMEEDGDYLAEGGKLYLDDEYDEYELDGDKLTLTGTDSEDDEDITDLIYPMVFERQ